MTFLSAIYTILDLFGTSLAILILYVLSDKLIPLVCTSKCRALREIFDGSYLHFTGPSGMASEQDIRLPNCCRLLDIDNLL